MNAKDAEIASRLQCQPRSYSGRSHPYSELDGEEARMEFRSKPKRQQVHGGAFTLHKPQHGPDGEDVDRESPAEVSRQPETIGDPVPEAQGSSKRHKGAEERAEDLLEKEAVPEQAEAQRIGQSGRLPEPPLFSIVGSPQDPDPHRAQRAQEKDEFRAFFGTLILRLCGILPFLSSIPYPPLGKGASSFVKRFNFCGWMAYKNFIVFLNLASLVLGVFPAMGNSIPFIKTVQGKEALSTLATDCAIAGGALVALLACGGTWCTRHVKLLCDCEVDLGLYAAKEGFHLRLYLQTRQDGVKTAILWLLIVASRVCLSILLSTPSIMTAVHLTLYSISTATLLSACFMVMRSARGVSAMVNNFMSQLPGQRSLNVVKQEWILIAACMRRSCVSLVSRNDKCYARSLGLCGSTTWQRVGSIAEFGSCLLYASCYDRCCAHHISLRKRCAVCGLARARER
eukprot:TRINITY_DN12072_c0_g1_i1.p1 TRINITY_DN12072_c0_g1~~TRINITY_DN12072_c0_g1_i1.p1  ORF type:complete len:455 (+),score=54.48 TRINITY_DN12072_c0_g1_i1:495-1859(+)